MKSQLCFFLPFLSFCATSLSAQLVIYSFTGAAGSEVSFEPDSQPANATASAMTRGAGINPSSNAGTFSATGWSTGDLDAGDYFSFSIAPDPGFQISLSSTELDERRSGTGILNWTLRSSLDGFTANLMDPPFAVPDNTSTRVDQSISLDPGTFVDLTTAVEFRIYGFNAESGVGSWRIDNVEVFGAIAAVPEPREWAFTAGCALLVFLSVRRWNRRHGRLTTNNR